MNVLMAVIIVCLLIIASLNIFQIQPREKFTKDTDLDLTQIHGLAFSSAGVLGYSFLGALENLVDRGLDLNNVKYFAGASAGSLAAIMLACRIPVHDIKEHFFDTDIKGLFDKKYKHERMKDNLKSMSFVSSHYIEDSMEKLLYKHTGVKNITLGQIYEKYGTVVVIGGTNLEYISQPLYMTHYTHPTLTASRAARASSSIPFIFAPVKVDESSLVDGAVVDVCVLKELQNYLDISEILCVSLDYLNMIEHQEQVIKKFTRDIQSFFTGIWRAHPVNKFTKAEKERTIYVACHECPSTFKFSLTDEDKQKIYQRGFESVDRYFSGYEYNL
jgi:predicted acylesterase/phospholipase RssA